MNIADLMKETRINLNLTSTSKSEVLKELIDMLEQTDGLVNRNAFEEAVFKREDESTTGIGMDVAIPHGKSSGVKEPAIVFGKKESGINFDSLDGKPAKMFFLIAVPDSSSNIHLDILKQLSRSLMHQDVRDKVMHAQTKSDLLSIFTI